MFAKQIHLIFINAANYPTLKTVFGKANTDVIGIFVRNHPFEVLVPPNYDPNEISFVHQDDPVDVEEDLLDLVDSEEYESAVWLAEDFEEYLVDYQDFEEYVVDEEDVTEYHADDILLGALLSADINEDVEEREEEDGCH